MARDCFVFENVALRLAIQLATALGFCTAVRPVYCDGEMTEVLELACLRPERKCWPGHPQPSWLWQPEWRITPSGSGEVVLDHTKGDYPRQLFKNPCEAVKAALRNLELDKQTG